MHMNTKSATAVAWNRRHCFQKDVIECIVGHVLSQISGGYIFHVMLAMTQNGMQKNGQRITKKNVRMKKKNELCIRTPRLAPSVAPMPPVAHRLHRSCVSWPPLLVPRGLI